MNGKLKLVLWFSIVLILGIIIGFSLSKYIPIKLAEKAVITAELKNILMTVKVLERLRASENERAIKLLETNLDPSIEFLNISLKPEQLESEQIKKTLNLAREYKEKYPSN